MRTRSTGSATEWDVVVVGAGLGGLACAAHLARGSRRVLVLESASSVGGQCNTAMVAGTRFIVGANGFGAHAHEVLRELGTSIEPLPSTARIFYRGTEVGSPAAMFRNRSVLGTTALGLVSTMARLVRASKRTPAGANTYADAIARVASGPGLQDILHLFAWLVATHPSVLPASSLSSSLGATYGYGKTWYPAAGAQAIPEALASIVRSSGGEIHTGRSVERITVERGVVSGVLCDGEHIPSPVVVSNAEIRRTLALAGDAVAPEIRARIDALPRSLSVATLLLLVSPDAPILKRIDLRRGAPGSIVILDDSVAETMARLESGEGLPNPVICIALGEAIAQAAPGRPVPLSVVALWPNAEVDEDRYVDETLARIERHVGEFGGKLLHCELVTPGRYESRFGFSSCPAPVLERVGSRKPGRALFIPGLFNVGASVQPQGTHAGAALESGRLCARELLVSV
ncbi:MAG: FAD-dependent oxidoreductase [Myxococcaceae bacterium]